MNRHHPYGGYDERSSRGGRGGGPASRGRPPRPGGMSPPPSAYPPAQSAYNPAANDAPYQPQNAYAPTSEFSGGPDRHYQMPMSGVRPPRGGMGGRRGHTARPPGHAPDMSGSQAYGYTPASYETAPYNAYDQSSYAPNPAPGPAPLPPAGPPPFGQTPGYSQDYNNYGRPPPFDQSGPPPGQYGARPPRGGGPGFRGGRGGGRGGRGGGFGGGGGARGDDEKPCRTIFVRSINFETDAAFVEQEFKRFGEIKTFFDMVNKRGIAFITYYDLRAARDAMLTMKGAVFGGRPINIHYSLPREEDKAQRCDRDKNQGTLFTVLRGANEALADEAVHQVFSEFGDVKKIRDYPGQKNSRFVEYFDSRACQLAHDRLNGQNYLDGQWDLKFAWDVVTDDDLEWAQAPSNAAGPGFQAGQPGWAQPGPPPQQQPLSDRAPLSADYPSYDNAGPPPALGYGRAPVPPTGPPVDNGWGRRSGSGSAGPGGALSPVTAAAGLSGVPAGQADASRLEQAQKVQQLLASLGAAGKPAAPAASTPPARSPPPALAPTTSATAAAPALPANIAALLQSAAGAPKPMQPPKPQSPTTSNASASGEDNGQQSMHQLLSMLNQNRPPRPS